MVVAMSKGHRTRIEDGVAGHAVFITEIPSSGKSSAADRLAALAPAFTVVTGDDEIRALHSGGIETQRLFAKLLDLVESRLLDTNLVIDMTLPESYVTQAKARFPKWALFVAIHIDERERRARELARRDRSPVKWDSSLTALLGADELYDLVIDSSGSTPDESAAQVLSLIKDRWPHIAD